MLFKSMHIILKLPEKLIFSGSFKHYYSLPALLRFITNSQYISNALSAYCYNAFFYFDYFAKTLINIKQLACTHL